MEHFIRSIRLTDGISVTFFILDSFLEPRILFLVFNLWIIKICFNCILVFSTHLLFSNDVDCLLSSSVGVQVFFVHFHRR